MIGQFKPVTGVMGSGIGQFTLPGNNAGFCAAILQKSGTQTPLRLESLTYVRPDRRETLQQPLVVNLLMQLRTYYDQSNTYLRNQAALNIQLTNQLRQVLALSSGPVRTQAGAIQRAVQGNLYRNGEFQRALEGLAREVKKNGSSHQTLTVRLPDSDSVVPSGGRQSPTGVSGTVGQAMPVLRTPAISGWEEKRPVDIGSRRQAETPMVHRSPVGEPAETSEQIEPVRQKGQRGKKKGRQPTRAARMAEPAEMLQPGVQGGSKPNQTKRTAEALQDREPVGQTTQERTKSQGRIGTPQARTTAEALPAGETAAQATRAQPKSQRQTRAKPSIQVSPADRQEMKQTIQAASPAITERVTQAIQSLPVSTAREEKLASRGGDQRQIQDADWPLEGASGKGRWPTLWRQAERNFERPHIAQPFSTVVQSTMPTTLQAVGSTLLTNPLALYQLRYALPGQRSPVGAVVPLTGRLVTSYEYPLSGQQGGPRSFSPRTAGTQAVGEIGGSHTTSLNRSNALTGVYLTFSAPRSVTQKAAIAPLLEVPTAGSRDAARLWESSLVVPGGAVLLTRGSPAVPGATALAGARLTVLSRGHNLWQISQLGPKPTEKLQSGRPDGQKFLVPRTSRTAGPAETSGVGPLVFSHLASATLAGGWTYPMEESPIAGRWLPTAVPPPIGGAEPRISNSLTLTAMYPWLTRRSVSQQHETAPTGGSAVVARWAGLRRRPPWSPELPAPAVPPLGWTPGRLTRRTAPVPGIVPAGGGFHQIPDVSPVSREIFRMPSAQQTGRSGAVGSGLSARNGLVDSGSANSMDIFQTAVRGAFQPEEQLRTAQATAKMAGIGGHLIQIQQAVRGVLNGGYRGSKTALHRARQISVALSGLEAQADQVRQQALSPGLAPVLHRAISGENVGAAELFALLPTGGQRDTATPPNLLERSGQSRPTGTQSVPKMIYRRPEHPAPAQGESGGDNGEAVLRAQTVSPARVAAMNAAYSYPPGSNTGSNPTPPVEELTAEQEERITKRVLEDINYSRMASEVLDRVERRLRAERRKFGR